MSKVTAGVLLPIVLATASTYGSQAWVSSTRSSSGLLELYQLDVSTGNSLGKLGDWAIEGTEEYGQVWDLASAPNVYPNLLWGVTALDNDLLVIDPYQRRLISSSKIDVSDPIYSLAMHPNGSLLYGATESSLLSIDPISGVVSSIGPLDGFPIIGLGFDSDGRLLGYDSVRELVQIDLSNATTTVVVSWTRGIDYEDIAAHPEDGIVYLAEGLFTSSPNLSTLDVDSMQVAQIGPLLTPARAPVRVSGLAFTNVPEPAAAISMMLGLASLLCHRAVGRRA